MKTKLLSLLSVFIFFSFAIISCSKDEDEETTPEPSCSDGIQNQGEAGVDCGGPCALCTSHDLCNGISSSSYLPLADGNHWGMKLTPQGYVINANVSGTQVINSVTYIKLNYNTSYTKYLRVLSNGDINEFSMIDSTEHLYIPASPSLNQEWACSVESLPGLGSRKVTATNVTVNSTSCSYTGCIEITEYDQFGGYRNAFVYKKNVGLVKVNPFGNYYLFEVTLKF